MKEARRGSPAEINPKYQKNVLISQLPTLLSEEDFLQELSVPPAMDDHEFRKLPLHIRLEKLETLQELFVPFEYHAKAMARILRVMRWAYNYRNPTNPRIAKYIFDIAENGPGPGLSRESGGGGAIGLTITGVTGAGKTSFLDRFAAHLGDNVIIHSEIGGRRCRQPQILHVRVQCAEKASLSGVAENILQKIDELLGTRHSAGAKSLALAKLSNRVSAICSAYFVGILIIDDVQNLPSGNAETQATLNFFTGFMEKTGIPIVLTGTIKLNNLLAGDIAAASKLTAKGNIEFPCPGADDEKWVMTVETLWYHSITPTWLPMPPDLPKMLHFYTQGVTRILRETMAIIHERMATTGEGVTEEMLESIATGELLKYQEGMSVMRRHKMGLLPPSEAADWADFIPSDTSLRIIKTAIARRKEEAKLAAKAGAPEKSQSVPEALKSAKIVVEPPKKAPKPPAKRSTQRESKSDGYGRAANSGWLGKPISGLK